MGFAELLRKQLICVYILFIRETIAFDSMETIALAAREFVGFMMSTGGGGLDDFLSPRRV